MTKQTAYILFSPIAFFLVFLCVFGGIEFWKISVIQDPDFIEKYQFGSEAMILHGGEKYISPEKYSQSVLVLFVFSIIGLIVSTAVLAKSKQRALLKAYLSSIFTISILFIISVRW